MEQAEIEKLKYPLGKYKKPENASSKEINECIKVLEEFPQKLRQATKGLSDIELTYKHRPEGWAVRQLVHHLADSHITAFTRVKLALTENNPTVKPYIENEWVKLPDTSQAPIEWSLMIIEGVHNRLATLLKSLDNEQLQRTYFNPEYQKLYTIQDVILLYSWHCGHHMAHINQALKHKNNF